VPRVESGGRLTRPSGSVSHSGAMHKRTHASTACVHGRCWWLLRNLSGKKERAFPLPKKGTPFLEENSQIV